LLSSAGAYLRAVCGRFDNLIARDAYRGLFKVGRLPQSNFPLRYNVAPTDQIPIVRIDSRDGEREVVMARWGLIPFWMKEKPKVPHINARAETVHKLPLFREAFAKRRCLIPATGFYEWQKAKRSTLAPADWLFSRASFSASSVGCQIRCHRGHD
jgi:putative SOS response-associated peptidase YedK